MTTATPTRTTAPTPAPSTEARRLRAVLYVRISDDPEGLEKGVERQETDCRAYAEAQGFSGRSRSAGRCWSASTEQTAPAVFISGCAAPTRTVRRETREPRPSCSAQRPIRNLPMNDAARRIETNRAEQEQRRQQMAERERQISDPFEHDPHRSSPRREGPTRGL